MSGLGLVCRGNLSGIICQASPASEFKNIIISDPCAVGFRLSDPGAFFSRVRDMKVINCAGGIGILFGSASIYNTVTTGNRIGVWIPYCTDSCNIADQPAWNSFIPLIYGPAQSTFTQIHAIAHSIDEESVPYFQKCGAYMASGTANVFENCDFDTGISGFSSNPCPPVIIQSLAVSIRLCGCVFIPPGGKFSIEAGTGVFVSGAGITLENCVQPYLPATAPFTNLDGIVTVENPRQINNQLGLSASSIQANNLVGTFNILHGFTTGRIQFPTPEPDHNYILTFGIIGYGGSAPAVGSTEIVSYTNDADGSGSDVMVAVDPGSDCQLTFGWHLIRQDGPLYSEYLPSPSSITNPLVTPSPTGRFAVGFTLIPASGNVFWFSSTAGIESVCGAGTPGAADSWEFYLENGTLTTASWGASTPFFIDTFTDNGKLCSIYSPGPHNIVFGNFTNIFGRHINGWLGLTPVSGVFLDNGLRVGNFQPGASTGTQQTPLYIGERAGATNVLTSATMRNFKVALDPTYAITPEQDIGPQVGQTESAIFGDRWGLGFADVTNPSWASQIADARYGTGGYYWMAVGYGNFMTTVTVPDYWTNWGARHASLQNICVATGLLDIALINTSSATLMASLTMMMEGGQATATFKPPEFNAQSYGWFYTTSLTWTTAEVIINGTHISVPFVTDVDTTMSNLANNINANGAVNTAVLAVYNPTVPAGPASVSIHGLARGVYSNAVTLDATDVLRVFPGPGNMVGGGNALLTIQGTVFNWIFNTDAATTGMMLSRLLMLMPRLRHW